MQKLAHCSMNGLLGAYPVTSRAKYDHPDSVLQELIKENVVKCLDQSNANNGVNLSIAKA